MDYSMSPISNEDREPIIDIFNYYVENSFAAYPETKLSYEMRMNQTGRNCGVSH
jgi:L-amino acid N-acyltransferase YncA